MRTSDLTHCLKVCAGLDAKALSGMGVRLGKQDMS